MDLIIEHCSSWPQSLAFKYREIRKKKKIEFTSCSFYIRISFDRDIGHYVIKRSVLVREFYVVNQASMSGHTSYELDLSDDEKNQLDKFGKLDSTVQNAKNGLIHLFRHRTHDSSLIYRVFSKYRILQFGDSSDCTIKFMDTGDCHKSKGGIF